MKPELRAGEFDRARSTESKTAAAEPFRQLAEFVNGTTRIGGRP